MATSKDDVKQAFQRTRGLFVALGDDYRQEIMLILGEEKGITVQDLADRLGISRPTTSHHIKILKDAGLLGEHKNGTRAYYHPTVMNAVAAVKQLISAMEELQDADCNMLEGNQ